MIRALTLLLAALYCFVWLRIPEIGGVAFPIQRIVGWAVGFVLLAQLILNGRVTTGPAARSFLTAVIAFLVFLLLSLLQQLAFGDHFYLLYFAMDFAKYLAVFMVAWAFYYVLRAGLVSERRLVDLIMWSGVASVGLVYLFLLLYFAGFRTDNTILAPTFGGALGVWPTAGILPRLSGTAAEPQQLGVLLLTPVLLMLDPSVVRRYWPVAILGTVALLLSQSKYAVLSVLIVLGYIFVVYRRYRPLLLIAMLPLVPAAAVLLLRLPTFTETLSQGVQAQAFVERFENLLLLVDIIQSHFLFGIGAGHYGVYRGATVYGDPMYQPSYYPNMDFLKVFAETGAIGFVMLAILLGSLVRLFVRSYRRVPPARRHRYLAFLLGMIGILGNMAIGYELLHVFFWINVGMLIYLAETAPSATLRTVAPADGALGDVAD